MHINDDSAYIFIDEKSMIIYTENGTNNKYV